jgi:hypothetical protein
MIWGYPHFRKPPYGNRIGPNVSEARGSNIPKFRICMGAIKTISIWVVYDIVSPALYSQIMLIEWGKQNF